MGEQEIEFLLIEKENFLIDKEKKTSALSLTLLLTEHLSTNKSMSYFSCSFIKEASNLKSSSDLEQKKKVISYSFVRFYHRETKAENLRRKKKEVDLLVLIFFVLLFKQFFVGFAIFFFHYHINNLIENF